ncbi:hypothetical protein AURDEDRAFT_130091 [Auricularia subglabra TFB-10046 SS5]|uniref:F-box domain-containing protein n=1 Tax=Auricularia subglabra (strain TFB-10046 / SS5) TaxID=717982 RepID=J0CYI3_AURST|nr:hypothetical protein AURDEDRAFT_130091 [Auricularia subglabra TFB-10046 SS5]
MSSSSFPDDVWPPLDRAVRRFAVPTNVDALISMFEHLDSRSLLAVSKTCSQWRTIALSTPTLWWDIQLIGSNDLQTFRLFVRRSSNAAVCMKIVSDNGPCVEEALATVLRCRARIVSLAVSLSADFDFDSQYAYAHWASLDEAFDRGFPLLCHLAIHFPVLIRPIWPQDVVKLEEVEQLCALRFAATSESTPRLVSFEFSGITMGAPSLCSLPSVTVLCVQLDVVFDGDISALFCAFPGLRVLGLVSRNISALASLPLEDARLLSQLEELHLFSRNKPHGYMHGIHLLSSANLRKIRHVYLHGLEGHADACAAMVAALDRPCHVTIGAPTCDFRTQLNERHRDVEVETVSGLRRSCIAPEDKIWHFARPALEHSYCATLTVHCESWKLIFGRNAQLLRPGALRNVRTLRVLLSPRLPLADLALSSNPSTVKLRMPDLERLEFRAEPNTIVRVSTDELSRFLKLFEELAYLDAPVFHGVYIYPGRVPAPDLLYLAD